MPTDDSEFMPVSVAKRPVSESVEWRLFIGGEPAATLWAGHATPTQALAALLRQVERNNAWIDLHTPLTHDRTEER